MNAKELQDIYRQEKKEAMTVRRLASIPLGVIESLAKSAPSLQKRYVREIIIRIQQEDRTIKSAEISSHATDAMMQKDKLFKALGLVVYSFYESLSSRDQFKFGARAMTADEQASLLGAILAPIEGEEDEPEEAEE